MLPHAQARHEFGLAKYGTPLRTANGRDALVDALQEALDGMVYARAAGCREAELLFDAAARALCAAADRWGRA